MPIKICFVSLYAYSYFNPKIQSQFGGSELQLYYLATGLARDSQFRVSFVTGDFGQPDGEIIQDVKLYKFFKPKGGYVKAFFGFFRLWMTLKNIDADVYIQRATGFETGVVALFCKLSHKKFIYMVANDEDVVEKKPDYFQNGLAGWLRWRLFSSGFKNADIVFVQHANQKETLKKNYGKKGVIRKSAHYIEDISENQHLNQYKSTVLWVGKADQYIKQPEVFIELAKEFPNENFVMICPPTADNNYFKKIKEEVKKIKNLEFVGGVSFNEIEDFFKKAKIFINTSKTEGFPNTFIQSVKNKTPIISLNINPDGMLEKNKIGICANGDFKKIKEHLKTLLENKNLWHRMSENGYKYAKENHDIKKIIEEDKKIIYSLIKPFSKPMF